LRDEGEGHDARLEGEEGEQGEWGFVDVVEAERGEVEGELRGGGSGSDALEMGELQVEYLEL
jgi:hypothetical protein